MTKPASRGWCSTNGSVSLLPAGTPAEIGIRINTEVNKMLADRKVQDSLEQQALEPVGGTIEAADKLFRGDIEKYGRLKEELNIKAE